GKRSAHFAARYHQLEVLEEIVKRKGDLQARDRKGLTPLGHAIEGESYEAAEYLVRNGCKASAEDLVALRKRQGGPEKEKMAALLGYDALDPYVHPDTQKETLSEGELAQFLEATTLNDRITAAERLPFEKLLSAREPLPLIFCLIKVCSLSHKSYQDQLHPFIIFAAKKFPKLRDAEGYTFSHLIASIPLRFEFKELVDLSLRNNLGQTPLHIAAREAPEASFEMLLSLAKPEDLEAVDQFGRTPLFYAVRGNRPSIVRALLDKGANVNHYDNQHFPPFALAFFKKHSKVLIPLLEWCDVDVPFTIKGQEITPLECLAANEMTEAFVFALKRHPVGGAKAEKRKEIPFLLAERGDLEGTRHMMKAHRSLFFEKQDKMFPWDRAALRGHLPLLDYFCREVPEFFKYGEDLLWHAALGGQREVAAFLVEKGILEHISDEAKEKAIAAAGVSNCKETARFYASLFVKEGEKGHVYEGASKAIESAIALNRVNALSHFYEKGEFPVEMELGSQMPGLHLAASQGSLEAVKYLSARPDANPYQIASKNGATALESAAQGGNPTALRYLLEKFAPPVETVNEKGETLLHLATRSGRLANVMLLLDQGYDLNIRDGFGYTPQEIAAIEGRRDHLELFLLMGADEDSIERIVGRAKSEAAKGTHLQGHFEGVLSVVEKFRAVSSQCGEGETPLHLAVRSQHKGALTLLARSSVLEGKDGKGQTPLHLAAALGDVNAVRILVGHGAKVDEKDIDIAKQQGKDDVAKLLESLEGKVYDACA
ncbi:MAG: ankyrin repeat domain-containing protein, partial [Chlamydiia bacterium]|nr:ankyrin repeat domain-containing protein [Chlamydiia bacterium]